MATAKKTTQSIAITPFYQNLFIGAVLVGWLVGQSVLLRLMTRHGVYLSSGTWLFQLSSWGVPVIMFGLALLFAVTHESGWRRRFFFSTMLATIGLSVYDALASIEQYWYTTYYTRAHPLSGSSYWESFGNNWIVMIVGVVLFATALFVLRKKGQ